MSEVEGVLTGLEPYRDAYQIAVFYDRGTEEYENARSRIYDELEMDIDVSRMDQFHVLQLLQDGKAWESFEYLEQEVLEE